MSMGTQMLVGCLPLLLTMPFLIAFYRVLRSPSSCGAPLSSGSPTSPRRTPSS